MNNIFRETQVNMKTITGEVVAAAVVHSPASSALPRLLAACSSGHTGQVDSFGTVVAFAITAAY